MMIVTAEKTKKEVFVEHLQDEFEKNEIDFGKEIRKGAAQSLAQLDFPTRKTEYYKYTSINKIVNQNYQISQKRFTNKQFVEDCLIPQLDQYKLVFVNGFFQPHLSDEINEPGVETKSIAEAIRLKDKGTKYVGKYSSTENEVFATMNMQYFTDGIFIHISKDTKIEHPIHIINIVDGQEIIALSRNLIVAEQGADAKFIESFVSTNGSSKTFNNTVTEICAEENAKIEWNKIQTEADNENYHICSEYIRQENNAKVNSNTFSLGGSIVRNNLNFYQEGENCETHLYGFYFSKEKSHIDNHTIVNHLKANCFSNEQYKGIIDDESTCVFNGRIYVKQDAQKIDSYQSNGNILLGDKASVNSKPELEIYANDVKCSHGSATGKLDQEALFYLKSRGLSEENAKKLLLTAYAGEVLDHLTIQSLRKLLEEKIAEQLGRKER